MLHNPSLMRGFLTTLLAILPSILRSRAAVELENLALRHEIGVLHPETVLAWHRAGFRLFWTWKGLTMASAERQSRQRRERQIHTRRSPEVQRGQLGRPVISREVDNIGIRPCRSR